MVDISTRTRALLAALMVSMPLAGFSALKRNPEIVDVPRACQRFYVEFEREKIVYPIRESAIEYLAGKSVVYEKGRCIVVLEYLYDAALMAKLYAKDQGFEDIEGFVEKFKKGEELDDIKSKWNHALKAKAATSKPPHRFTIQYVFEPLQSDFPTFLFNFHGEEI